MDIATRVRTAMPETNGTANGAAGGSLSTASFANQSNTQSASAFMQAFGSDSVELLSNPAGELTGARVTGRLAVQLDTVQGGLADSASPAGGNVTSNVFNSAGQQLFEATDGSVTTTASGNTPLTTTTPVGGVGGADNITITVAGN